MEEGISRQGLRSLEQPLVEVALLARRGVQLVPHVHTPARGAQAGQPQLRAVRVGDGRQRVELGHV